MSNNFFEQMAEIMAALDEALYRYQKHLPTETETVDVAAKEQQLFALFDAYFAAEKMLDAAKKEMGTFKCSEHHYKYPLPNDYNPLKRSASPTSLADVERAKAEAREDWERGHKAWDVLDLAEKAFNEVKRQIHDVMPHYVWVEHPASGRVFGISTGTWGAGEWHLHIRDIGSDLYELVHQTYYA